MVCYIVSYLRYSSFLTSCSRAPNRKWVPIFLVHSFETHVFNHSTRMFHHSTRGFNHSTRVFKFVFDRYGFTSMCSSSGMSSMHCKYVMSSDSSLRVHTNCHVHYLSSSNSPVHVRIRKHIRKGRGLILLVTGPAKINHLRANYTEFYFCYYLPFRMQDPISISCRRKPFKCFSSDEDFVVVV